MVTERVPINNSLSLSRAHMHVSQIFPIALLHPAENHPAKCQKHTACLLGRKCANACICICSVSNRAHATAQIQQNGCLSNQSPPPPPPPPISLPLRARVHTYLNMHLCRYMTVAQIFNLRVSLDHSSISAAASAPRAPPPVPAA